MWLMMSAGDVAVMPSLRADVSWCKSGTWRHMRKVLSGWRHMKKVLGVWRRVKKFVDAWKHVEHVRR